LLDSSDVDNDGLLDSSDVDIDGLLDSSDVDNDGLLDSSDVDNDGLLDSPDVDDDDDPLDFSPDDCPLEESLGASAGRDGSSGAHLQHTGPSKIGLFVGGITFLSVCMPPPIHTMMKILTSISNWISTLILTVVCLRLNVMIL